MQPKHSLLNTKEAYCLRKVNKIYAAYIPKSIAYTINLKDAKGKFTVQWYDPFKGGDLLNGSVTEVLGGNIINLGKPPENLSNQDWVILLKNKNYEFKK